MNRTVRAALLALVIGFVLVAGFGWFLGFGGGSSAVAGLVSGVVLGGIIVAAALRSGTLRDEPPPG